MWSVDNFRLVILVVGLCVNLDSARGQGQCYGKYRGTDADVDKLEDCAGQKHCLVDLDKGAAAGCFSAKPGDCDADDKKVSCVTGFCCCMNKAGGDAGENGCNDMRDGAPGKAAACKEDRLQKLDTCKNVGGGGSPAATTTTEKGGGGANGISTSFTLVIGTMVALAAFSRRALALLE